MASLEHNPGPSPIAPLNKTLLWMVLLLSVSFVLVFSSSLVWLQQPMKLIEHEFDIFLGVYSSRTDPHAVTLRAYGRWLHFVGFSLAGLFFWKLARSVKSEEPKVPVRLLLFFLTLIAFTYVIGTPWVSPDVFFYLGHGWLDGHYHLNPYLDTIASIPGFRKDEMFQNVFPGFLSRSSVYGPLFHLLAARLAVLSNGNEKIALALFKAINLATHAACCWLIYRLAPAARRTQALLLYAANPLVLFATLTCAHNDVLMILFVLLGFFALSRNRPLAAGIALGFAASVKYVPVLFLPFICVSLALKKRSEDTARIWHWAAPAILLDGFLISCAVSYSFYPAAFESLVEITRFGGPGVYRNSIYHVFWALRTLGLPAPKSQTGWTFGVFLIGYVLLWLDHFRRALRGAGPMPARACLLALSLYFVTTMQSVQEWYVPWMLAIAAILDGDEPWFIDFGLTLSCVFMPLVIFTIKYGMPQEFIANVAIYGLVLACTLRLWMRVYYFSVNEAVPT